jgi:hypothetical protein
MMLQRGRARLLDQHPIGRSRNERPITPCPYRVIPTWVISHAYSKETSFSRS